MVVIDCFYAGSCYACLVYLVCCSGVLGLCCGWVCFGLLFACVVCYVFDCGAYCFR